ncbi:uncharacterized protein Z518_07052 [Rhinocladiella mackenziei CBS 650.93]|uniref:Uncharacterized protein n=1 Tax=Rhinocladiella mackenziei CBS 650.93 TaxID=1442369 RepID=A0A0D2ICG9_9EURO|nr:uncharacterized protein Z518_07052 [Rhinocladiella mackenziei CBS 650.93]KIX03499.1 hypothetical protein Z518_07052 [Rhinocladiella mackenziei CBS 650.93]
MANVSSGAHRKVAWSFPPDSANISRWAARLSAILFRPRGTPPTFTSISRSRNLATHGVIAPKYPQKGTSLSELNFFQQLIGAMTTTMESKSAISHDEHLSIEKPQYHTATGGVTNAAHLYQGKHRLLLRT